LAKEQEKTKRNDENISPLRGLDTFIIIFYNNDSPSGLQSEKPHRGDIIIERINEKKNPEGMKLL
jgi:hypothetical protein